MAKAGLETRAEELMSVAEKQSQKQGLISGTDRKTKEEDFQLIGAGVVWIFQKIGPVSEMKRQREDDC